jgi:hypothetical protein
MYATNYFENAMLNVMRGTSITAPAAMYLALFLSNPGDTGTDGTEITYSGYARQAVTFSAPTVSGSGLMIENTALISFPEATTSAGTVTYVAVYDSLSGGNMWLYGQLDTALTVQTGVSPVFRAGSVRWIWTGNLTTYYRTAIMNTLRGTNCSGFSPYVGFCNGDPTGSGSEFSGNNYARIAVTMTAPAQQSSGTALSQNTADVLSSVATGNWGTLNTVAIFDAQSSGNAYGVINLGTSYNVTSGYAVGFHAGALQFNIN